MKHIQLYMLATFVFCMQQISVGEQSQEAFETERQAIIDSNIIKYSYLSDAFNFLQSQDLIHESFHDFLDNTLSHDKDEELEFGVVIDQAEGVLTANMKDIFIQTLENAITHHKKLNEFDRPIFLYAMQHKDDFMHGIVNLWLYEWSKIKNDNGQAPLHRAAQYNNQEITSMLFAVGADFNLQDNNGRTPLHITACYRNSKIAHMLILANVNLNIQDNRGETSLFLAVIYKSPKIVRMLIDAGADINLKNEDGCIPLHMTVYDPSSEIADILILILILTDVNLNIQDKYGWSPLYTAVFYNKPEIVCMLIDAGANVNIQNNNGKTPLHRAAWYNYQKIVRMLINAGADLNIEDNDGLTAEQRAETFEIRTLFSQAHMHRESSCNIS